MPAYVPHCAAPRRRTCRRARHRADDDTCARAAPPPRRRTESPRRRDTTLVQSALAYWGNLWANFQDANLDELFEARYFERGLDPDVEEHTHDHRPIGAATATCMNGPSSGT